MFKKKDTPTLPPVPNYTNWSNDFGFLVLIMDRKISIFIDYNLKILAKQTDNGANYISDNDITENDYTTLLNDIYNTLSPEYIKFMTTKYFNGDKALIGFISEYIRTTIINEANEINSKKIIDSRKDEINKQIDIFNSYNIAKMNK